jgi:hypothetical protein
MSQITAAPVKIGGVQESGYPGTPNDTYAGPFLYKGKLFGIFSTLGQNPSRLQVFMSADNGATWTQQDSTHAPSVIGSIVQYNTFFDPVAGIIYFAFTPTTTTLAFGTFDCNAFTFTATFYPTLIDTQAAIVAFDLVVRADGSAIATYTNNANHLIYRVNTAGTWGAATQATPQTGGHSYITQNLVLDSTQTTHLIYLDTAGGVNTWTHVTISNAGSGNVLGTPGVITTALQLNGDTMFRGAIWQGQLVLPVVRVSSGGTVTRASVFLGNPVATPVWSVVDVQLNGVGETILDSNVLVSGTVLQSVWGVNGGVGIAPFQMRTAANPGTGYGPISVFYDAALNPPPDNLANTQQEVQDVALVIDAGGGLSGFVTLTDAALNFAAYYLKGASVKSLVTLTFKGEKVYS